MLTNAVLLSKEGEMRKRKGFTMVEVMIVCIIVGILASVSVPLYRANIRRAMSSEGTALFGAVLTMQHVHFSTTGTYTQDKSHLMIDLIG